ncbi:hypothetical protein GBA52_028361 [Prunus armeniaca]|nr:hypothetical protein GBA52_028361 [Prunus armeniaca]
MTLRIYQHLLSPLDWLCPGDLHVPLLEVDDLCLMSKVPKWGIRTCVNDKLPWSKENHPSPADQEGQAAGFAHSPNCNLLLYPTSQNSKLNWISSRFMLLNSPVLDEMVVGPAYDDGHLEFVKQLLRLRRA